MVKDMFKWICSKMLSPLLSHLLPNPCSSGGPTQAWVRALEGFSWTFAPAKTFAAHHQHRLPSLHSPQLLPMPSPLSVPWQHLQALTHRGNMCSWTQLLCKHTSSHLTQGKRGTRSLWQQLTLKQLMIKSDCFPPDPSVPSAVLFSSLFLLCFNYASY